MIKTHKGKAIAGEDEAMVVGSWFLLRGSVTQLESQIVVLAKLVATDAIARDMAVASDVLKSLNEIANEVRAAEEHVRRLNSVAHNR